jgi:Zn ribbon nucleic-acid-binding protein
VKCITCGFLNKSDGVCLLCGYQMTAPTPQVVYRIPKKSKKQIEINKKDIEFFKAIWEERPHFCEVTGGPLDEFNVCYFSHVLTKKAYPRFRHYKKNIVLCSFDQHQQWEFGSRKQKQLQWIVLLEEFLKREYYQNEQKTTKTISNKKQ